MKLFSLLLITICFNGILNAGTLAKQATPQKIYKVQPTEPIIIDANWDKKPWSETQTEKLINYMGDKPEHFPDVQYKVRYDKKNIYVIFQVKDQYIRAVAEKIHGRVWEDSCVEFFFSPGPDISRGYFNLETNCKGIFLMGYSKQGTDKRGLVDLQDCKKINIAHSLRRFATSEISEPNTWYIEYSIPIEMLSKYIQVDQPSKGVHWKANFYKCADKTSHPHWLTWNKVINPTPKFHLPEYFGTLEFE